MKKWIEIFRTGKHTSQSGQTKNWTESDLDRMVSTYDPNNHEAPVVIGHPVTNHPAYGWVRKLKRSGSALLGKFSQVEPQFAELVEAGRFKKRSISVYPDGGLRHVGFLGAQPPAVKGLADIAFGDDGAETFEYGEKEADMPTIEELKKQLEKEKKARKKAEAEGAANKKKADKSQANFAESQAKAKKKEINDFVEQGVKDGKILPAWKKMGLGNFMETLDSQTETFEFSEGEKETPSGWFKKFLSSFSEHPLFEKMAAPDGDKKKQDSDFADDEKMAEDIAGAYMPEND